MLKTAPKPKENQGLSRIFSLVSELTALKKELESTLSLKSKELDAAIAEAKKATKGEQGIPGRDGKDTVDEKRIAREVASIIVEDVADRVILRMPKPKDGTSVQKHEVIAELAGYVPSAEEVAAKLPRPKDGKSITVEDVIAALRKEKKISIEHIHGLDETIKSIRSQTANGAYLHGGGDTVAAGTNVTIANINGRKVISATSGTSTFYTDTVSGTINGSNTAFTVPNTITSALALFLAGVPYQVGVDYTVSGTNITFTTAPDASLSGQPFYLIHV